MQKLLLTITGIVSGFFLLGTTYGDENTEQEIKSHALLENYGCNIPADRLQTGACLSKVEETLRSELASKRNEVRNTALGNNYPLDFWERKYAEDFFDTFDEINHDADKYIERYCRLEGIYVSTGSGHSAAIAYCRIEQLELEIARIDNLLHLMNADEYEHSADYSLRTYPIAFCELR